MEVHSHTHTPRKKWTHYFWEFLMLFLAVLAGFYAENIREHKVEGHRGKEYLRSFTADLKTDTIHYARLLDDYKEKIFNLRNYYNCYASIKNNRPYSSCLDSILGVTNAFPDLINADRTLQQLKSSGALRLLPREDADSITIYDAEVRKQIQGERTVVQEAQSDLRNSYNDVLDFEVLYNRLLIADNQAVSNTAPLIPANNKPHISRLFIMIARYKYLMETQYENILKLQAKAEILITYFINKYHFK